MPVSTRSHSITEETPSKFEIVKDAMAEKKKELTLDDLLKVLNDGNAETKSNFKSVEDTIKANHKVVEDYMMKNDEAIQKLQGRVYTLENTVGTLETTVTTLSDEIESLRRDNTLHAQKLEDMGRSGKQMDEDRRKMREGQCRGGSSQSFTNLVSSTDQYTVQ